MKKEVINSPIRWAGSKKKILNEMLTFFDTESEIYIEPFLGSGIVLINLLNNIEDFKFERIIVNDINSNIINFYMLLKDDFIYLDKKISRLALQYNKLITLDEKEKYYYSIREKYNKLNYKNKDKAILFYYLMKTGYNGVYRENSKGRFNVPFGRKEKINYDKEALREISKKIQNVEFYNFKYEDFFELLTKENILNKAFVYFDPPYIPEEKVANKKQELYTNKEFDHETFIKNISMYNINKYIISMSESTKADLVYKKLKKYKVDEISRTINPRKIISSVEIVFSNYEIKKQKNN